MGQGGCMGLKREGGVNATCYVDKLVKVYPSFGKVLLQNTLLLRGKTKDEMQQILEATISSFVERNKAGDLYFRLHTSGDFFSEDYANAWADTILRFPSVRFWVYTRSLWAVPLLVGCNNLAIYVSSDVINYEEASRVFEKYRAAHNNLGIAYMGSTALPKDRRWVVCPEISGKIKNSATVGACATCRLCMTYTDKIALRNIQFPIH